MSSVFTDSMAHHTGTLLARHSFSSTCPSRSLNERQISVLIDALANDSRPPARHRPQVVPALQPLARLMALAVNPASCLPADQVMRR